MRISTRKPGRNVYQKNTLQMEWTEVWRQPENREPKEGKDVIVKTEGGIVRFAHYCDGEYWTSRSCNNRIPDRILGWIPYPRTMTRPTLNQDIPLEVVWPYVHKELVETKRLLREERDANAMLMDEIHRLRSISNTDY